MKILYIVISAGAVEVAEGKPAYQSDTWGGLTADLAVNGDLTDYSHTQAGDIKWWRVDLGAKYSIVRFILFNRKGYCEFRRIHLIT